MMPQFPQDDGNEEEEGKKDKHGGHCMGGVAKHAGIQIEIRHPWRQHRESNTHTDTGSMDAASIAKGCVMYL